MAHAFNTSRGIEISGSSRPSWSTHRHPVSKSNNEERLVLEMVNVKPKLKWKSQDGGDARNMGDLWSNVLTKTG